jgi:hypothetical protein
MNATITPLPIQNSSWVIPKPIRAGEYPGSIQETGARGKLHWLTEQQADFFVDLTEAGKSDLKPYMHLFHEEAGQIQKTVIHRRLAIRFSSSPSKGEMVKILHIIDLAFLKVIYLYALF